MTIEILFKAFAIYGEINRIFRNLSTNGIYVNFPKTKLEIQITQVVHTGIANLSLYLFLRLGRETN